MNDKIIKALNWRYAVQVFDSSKTVSDKMLHTILESGRLAPSSFGIEAWKFFVVENPKIRIKLKEVGYGQPKITDAAKLIVIAYRINVRGKISQERFARIAKVQNQKIENLSAYKQMLDGSIAGKSDIELDSWIKAQAYIPLGIMIETASLLGVDSGPMEGSDADKVDQILGLKEKNLHATSMLALGYRGEDTAAKRLKVRQDFEEVVEFVK